MTTDASEDDAEAMEDWWYIMAIKYQVKSYDERQSCYIVDGTLCM